MMYQKSRDANFYGGKFNLKKHYIRKNKVGDLNFQFKNLERCRII